MISARWTPTEEEIPDAIVLSDARLTNYLAAAASTVLVADYFATVNEEIDFVWRKRWSVASILYLWNRYMTIITVVSGATFMFREIESNKVSCTSFIIAEGLVSTLLVASFDLMLILRVWILYGKTRRMSFILFPMLLAEMMSMLVILLLPATYLSDFIHLGRLLPGCYFTTPVMRGPYFAFYALPPILVTFVMFILTVYKCSLTLRKDKAAEMPIVTLFLRDGIIWFLVVFGIDGAQMIIWATGRATLTQVLIIPSLVLYSLVSSRVLLNTKALSRPSFEDGEESTSLLPAHRGKQRRRAS
ncbi:hypothetical protein DFH07DRAFT_281049 [Mycena maculata]|uniref:DUF6533 domain-containing protein n=1 Tax=Mycena maculata TaxID=230809 RepID=A0AAD7JQW5_9AGAR|nr:hypothetical protein DFH07DRAFT_281049 [Mycena maculata]